ncbi:MAG: ABC transporter substrate-binding protein [Bifidobacteriaceae bacterium]|jgi:peptide/nickel transport system substrate-binding protein|nr:ABC transporter substrate-binding protein [Bifidobacteriaceae bacterium]
MFTTRPSPRRLALGFTSLAASACLIVAGCSNSASDSGSSDGAKGAEAGPAAGGNISIAIGADPTNLDPRLSWVGQAYSINAHIFEPLVFRRATADGGTELFPLLATEWENRDDLTWVFHLREGVTFQNSEPFTAEAVKFTLDTIMDESFSTPIKTWTASIDSVTAEDPLTVVIKTKTPTRGLLNSLAQVPIVSPEAVGEFGEEFTLNPVGTGPYPFVSYTPGAIVELERYEDYWGEPGLPDTITWRIMPESSSRITALETGEVQIAENIPPDQLPALESKDQVKVLTSPTMRVDFLVVDFADKVMDSQKFREGISLAIDRQSLVDNILSGTTEVANSVSPPGTVGYNADLPKYGYDLDKAKELIAASGYDGSAIQFGAPSGRYQMDSQVGQAIAGMLSAAGVDVEFEALAWSEFTTQNQADAYDLYFLGQTDFTLYPTAFYLPLFHCDSSRGHYCDEEISRLIDESAAILDDAEAAAMYSKIQELLYTEYAVIPLYWEPQIMAVSAGVGGFELRQDEYIVVHKTGVAS